MKINYTQYFPSLYLLYTLNIVELQYFTHFFYISLLPSFLINIVVLYFKKKLFLYVVLYFQEILMINFSLNILALIIIMFTLFF